MQSLRRSHGLVRSVILFSSVLAIVGVIFAVVQYMDVGATAPERPMAAEPAAPPLEPPVATPGEPNPTLKIRDDMPEIRGGDKTSIRIYSPDSDVARMEFSAQEWRPTGRRKNEFEVIEPEIRFRTPGGQEVRVTADRGMVDVKKGEGGARDPRRGRLEGGVTLVLDRLSARDRNELPPDQRDAEPTPDRLIHAEFEDIEFDLETARVSTAGRFLAQAAEGEITGTGLAIRYNEVNSRIEELTIVQGGSIKLQRFGRTLRIALPGTEAADLPDDDSADVSAPDESALVPVEPPAEEEAPPATDDEGIPYLVTEQPQRTKHRPVETYEAVFAENVSVEQHSEDEAVSKLEARKLAFLFDFGPSQREAATGAPAEQADQPEALPAEPGAEPKPQVVLNWSGPMTVEFLGEDQSDATGDRVHVTANGEPVRVRDRQGGASCAELEFHNESGELWLRGSGDEDVTVTSADRGRLTGRNLHYDQSEGVIDVVGPGRLSDRRTQPLLMSGDESDETPSDVDIQFATRFSAQLDKIKREDVDPISGETVSVQREFLRHARFEGDVRMTQEDDSIAADVVDVQFGVPREAGSLADNIERLEAIGSAHLKHGPERIACEALEVTMDVNERGKVAPRKATAQGPVEATQGDRSITARERMIVDLRLYERPKPPFELAAARAIAVRRGVDPDTVDWDQQRREYEQKKRYAPGLRRLQAFGDVKVRDPDQNLNVAAELLDCSFTDGRRIETARVTGAEPTASATVELGEYSIQGRTVDLDASKPSAEVPGPGRLSFYSHKDLDGRELENAIPIAVSWLEGMTFRGHQNNAVFEGSVHAASQDSTFDCQRLSIDFEDAKVVEAEPEPETNWWIFRGLFEPDRADDEFARIVAPRFDKEPIFLSGSGGAVALTSSFDEKTRQLKSRARLASSAIDLDLKRKVVGIEDAGTLLIEDYRPPKEDKARGAKPTTPFGGLTAGEGTQTYFKWAGSMSYNFRHHIANFERDVAMAHRSGSKLLMSERLTGQAPSDPDQPDAGEGREAHLTCNSLFVQFRPASAEESRRGAPGLSRLSGYDLDKFQAESDVYFEDSGVTVIAHRVTYSQEQTLLSIFGTRAAPAQLYDQRSGFRSITGPVIYWNRTNNRIEAPDSKIFAR